MSQVMNATVKGMVNSLQEEAYSYFFSYHYILFRKLQYQFYGMSANTRTWRGIR